MDQVRPALVKRGATIGANSTIVCGTTLGSYCFIGAGAVIIKMCPTMRSKLDIQTIKLGWVCEFGERLSDDLKCLVCGNQYRKDTQQINGLSKK